MLQTISIILNAILSSGILVSLLTINSTRAKAKASAKSVEIDNAQRLLDNFDNFIVQPLKNQVNDLNNTIQDLQLAIKQIPSCPHSDACPVANKLAQLHHSTAITPQRNPLPSPADPESF
ncbi:MAG: hypothetical protein MJ002_05630 [Paludibacteraceae bacterium]|nr:hypothetical protein [Paludibacteraceae bacterium]